MRMTEREALTLFGAWLRSSDRPVRIPSRTVDFAVGIISGVSGYRREGGSWVWGGEEGGPPRFSSDFSAALSLVPGNCRWSLEGDKSHPWCEVAHVWTEGGEDASQERADMDGPAAALCAAAVKFRWKLIRSGQPIAPEPDWRKGEPGDDIHEMDLDFPDDGSPVQDSGEER